VSKILSSVAVYDGAEPGMKKPVPISDERAYDGSCRTYKHDDLIKHIIDQIGHPVSISMRSCMNWPGRLAPMPTARHCSSATHNNTWTTALGGALGQRARWCSRLFVEQR
jgi:hypothetical protein